MMKKGLNFIKARFKKWLNEEIWIEDLIKMGMKVGQNCSIQPGVVFDYSHCWLIKIGNNVTIAPEAYILTHDASTKSLPKIGYTKIGSITIEDNVFVGARALIMPGVTIGESSIVAAGSIVTKSVLKGSVVGGNPARIISTIEDYESNQSRKLKSESSLLYGVEYTLIGKINKEQKNRMYYDLNSQIGFIK